MIHKLFTTYSPPGMNLNQEKSVFCLGLVLASLYSTTFWGSYFEARNHLFAYIEGKYQLVEGRKIEEFYSVLGSSLLGFVILSVCMLGFLFYRYSYYKNGSRSIYLMRRLPERSLLYKTIVVLPVTEAILSMVAAMLLLLFYFLIYILVTPKSCLPPECWQMLWRIPL